jgi:nuclear pore complex protein Nup85
MADEVLVRVPLQLQRAVRSRNEAHEVSDQDSAKIRAGDLAGVLKDVNTSCYEHQRESARREVCRVCGPTALLYGMVYPVLMHVFSGT